MIATSLCHETDHHLCPGIVRVDPAAEGIRCECPCHPSLPPSWAPPPDLVRRIREAAGLDRKETE